MKTHLILIMVFVLLTGSLSAQDKKASVSLTAAIYEEEVTGNLDKAVVLYLDILKKYPDDRQVAAKTLYHLGLVNEKMGKQKANEYFTRLVSTYPDQTEMAAMAKARLAVLGSPGGTGELVARRVLTDFSGLFYGGYIMTANGKFFMEMDIFANGDINQFEVSTGKKSIIKNTLPFTEFLSWIKIGDQIFSPDGKHIIYNRASNDQKNPDGFELRIRNLDGSGLRTLFSQKGGFIRPLDWSPDGRFILVNHFRKKGDWKGELTLISIADTSVRVLRTGAVIDARFSPDGGFIAFELNLTPDGPSNDLPEGTIPLCEIYLMTADGRNEVVVAGHPSNDRLVGWVPDGKSLVFLSDRSEQSDLWAVRINGGKQQGEPELLKKDLVGSVYGITPDGSLYYISPRPAAQGFGRLYIGEVDI
jgi:hypothetical protein